MSCNDWLWTAPNMVLSTVDFKHGCSFSCRRLLIVVWAALIKTCTGVGWERKRGEARRGGGRGGRQGKSEFWEKSQVRPPEDGGLETGSRPPQKWYQGEFYHQYRLHLAGLTHISRKHYRLFYPIIIDVNKFHTGQLHLVEIKFISGYLTVIHHSPEIVWG